VIDIMCFPPLGGVIDTAYFRHWTGIDMAGMLVDSQCKKLLTAVLWRAALEEA
jgi:hypothetical protein